MIKIVQFGKMQSGGSTNIRDILVCIDKESLVGYETYTIDDFKKSFNAKNGDLYVIWMVNHLTFILTIYLFFVSFFKNIRISSVVHNSFLQPQTSNPFHNFFATILEQITFLVSDKNLYISKILFKKSLYKNKFLISDVLPFNQYLSYSANRKINDIDLLFIGRNLPYKNLILLKRCLDIIDLKLNVFIVGQHVSRIQWADTNHVKINVIDSYISENEYLKYIKRSKLLVLPYKSVSAAGPLVDALTLNSHVLLSDLPFFKLYNKSPNVNYFISNDINNLTFNIKKFFKTNKHKNNYLNSDNPYSWTFLLLKLKEVSAGL